ncbi:MAG: MBL fold metallo-hydrolase [Anaerolineae bacterium]|nr:MBL fold metallo-hydrolase [Anaerolineae bacterium]
MIIQLPIGLMGSNCYVIYDHDQGEGAIVDPGVSEAGPLMREVNRHQLHIQSVLNTHGHFDHVLGNSILDLPGAQLAIHAGDRDLLLAGGGAPMFGLPFVPSPEPTLILEDGMVLAIGDLRVEVLHTPGHTPGSVCFHISEEHGLLTGDTLFEGSVGRTDLPGGCHQTLERSLKRLCELPGSTRVYPGHGDATTIDRERRVNPFLRHLS